MSTRNPGRPVQAKEEVACKVEGCCTAAAIKGLCRTHYTYSRRGIIDPVTGQRLREPKRVARYEEGSTCIVSGCSSHPRSRGMCNKHMLQREAGIIDNEGQGLRAFLPTGRKRERERWVASTRDGYVLVVAPVGHPNARADGTILEHRLVVEKNLGRHLHEWEIVHHKDGDRQNNDPSNLLLLDGRARKGEGHAPGSTLDADQVKLSLEHLRLNDPIAYNELVAKLAR